MFQSDVLESAICEELAQIDTCSIEELYQRLPSYSWGEVISVVDRLTRQGTIVIKNPAPSRYFLSLTACRANLPRDAV